LENKRAEQVLPRSSGGKVAQIMYTYVSKCKNDKIKIIKNQMKDKRGQWGVNMIKVHYKNMQL
jgi:hypothetical protein